MVKHIGIALGLLALTSCGLYPYQNKVACRLQDASGKCLSVSDAYDEAVTGEEKYAYLEKRKHVTEKQLLDPKQSDASNRKQASNGGALSKRPVDSAVHYNTQRLDLISRLIDEPTTPMLTPPKTVRTLVISTTHGGDSNKLYMPRYIYSIVEPSRFVLDNYLDKNDVKPPLGLMGEALDEQP